MEARQFGMAAAIISILDSWGSNSLSPKGLLGRWHNIQWSSKCAPPGELEGNVDSQAPLGSTESDSLGWD